MKRLLLVLPLLVATLLYANSIYVLERGGRASIATSNTKGDKVVGVNKSLSSILRIEQGTFTVSIPIKSFDFDDYKLIDQFAGEHYLNADKEPMMFINGKIPGAAKLDFTKLDQKNISLNADLKINGVSKSFPINLTLSSRDYGIEGQISLSNIKVEDFGIELTDDVKAELGDGFRMACTITWKKIEAPKKD